MSKTAQGKKTTFVGKDLGIFSSTVNNFFVFNVARNKGIQCRFGMRGEFASDEILFITVDLNVSDNSDNDLVWIVLCC